MTAWSSQSASVRGTGFGERGPQAAGELVDLGQLPGLGALPLLAPAPDLPFEEPVGPAELAEADRVVVDRVDLGEDVDEHLGGAPGVIG